MPVIRLVVVCCCALVVGCTSTKTTNTVRTGTEQLLISNAVDQSLAKMDFTPLVGKQILVEEKYLDSIDKNYIISSVRHHVLHAGGHLAAKPEEADIILELRSGGVGTDNSDAFIGMPGLTVPGMVSLPDVKLLTRTRQSAYAKLGIVAIDAKTKHELNFGGVSLAMSDDNNWYVMGVGPYKQGTINQEVKSSLDRGPIDEILPAEVVFGKPTTPASPIPRILARSKPKQSKDVAGRIQLTGGEEEADTKQPSAQEQPNAKP